MTEPSPWGTFPFGRPNTERPDRVADTTKALVIGVYPSALHVSWRAPRHLSHPDRSGRVRSLAVDVEPEVFWDGAGSDSRCADWMTEIGFVEGDAPDQHGTVGAPSQNGPSGEKLVTRYLGPLDVRVGEASFTDVFPVFMTKRGTKAERGQRDAVEQEYDVIATAMGFAPSAVPERIPPARLPAEAASRFGRRLLDLIDATQPEVVITLGVEPWETLALLPQLTLHPPAPSLVDLYAAGYGSSGSLQLGSHEAAWIPLVHPGLLADDVAEETVDLTARRSPSGWNRVHSAWQRSRQV